MTSAQEGTAGDGGVGGKAGGNGGVVGGGTAGAAGGEITISSGADITLFGNVSANGSPGGDVGEENAPAKAGNGGGGTSTIKGGNGGSVLAAGLGGKGGKITVTAKKRLTVNNIAIAANGGDGGTQRGVAGNGGAASPSTGTGGNGGDVDPPGRGGGPGQIILTPKPKPDFNPNPGKNGLQKGTEGKGGSGATTGDDGQRFELPPKSL
jgi:hypothetical protein